MSGYRFFLVEARRREKIADVARRARSGRWAITA